MIEQKMTLAVLGHVQPMQADDNVVPVATFPLPLTSVQGVCWVMDDAYLKEPGPRAEGIPEREAGSPGVSASPPPPGDPDGIGASSSGPVTPVLYVSPTSGQLSPGEESRIRLTFTPNRAGVLTFALPVWLARVPERGTRPYLTLYVKVKADNGADR